MLRRLVPFINLHGAHTQSSSSGYMVQGQGRNASVKSIQLWRMITRRSSTTTMCRHLAKYASRSLPLTETLGKKTRRTDFMRTQNTADHSQMKPLSQSREQPLSTFGDVWYPEPRSIDAYPTAFSLLRPSCGNPKLKLSGFPQ